LNAMAIKKNAGPANGNPTFFKGFRMKDCVVQEPVRKELIAKLR